MQNISGQKTTNKQTKQQVTKASKWERSVLFQELAEGQCKGKRDKR